MNKRHIGYLVKSINDKIKVKADADLKRHNLTRSQSRVLAYLNSRGGRATQKEIEDFLEVSHPTVVGIVSRMEQNGFLTCWFDQEDKRNKVVCLTELASAIGEELDSVIELQEAQMLKGLSDEQVDQLVEMLMTVYKNVDEKWEKF